MDMDIYRRIGLVCSRIPRGRVATYGQIALLCGKPGNSRQVGYALKKGLAGENVPAHRVVNAAGILSGAAHFASMDLQCCGFFIISSQNDAINSDLSAIIVSTSSY